MPKIIKAKVTRRDLLTVRRRTPEPEPRCAPEVEIDTDHTASDVTEVGAGVEMDRQSFRSRK